MDLPMHAYQYDYRLNEAALHHLKSILHLPIHHFSLENASMACNSHHEMRLHCNGQLRITFSDAQNGLQHLILTGWNEEIKALPDQGRLAIACISEPYLPLQERLKRPAAVAPFGGTVRHQSFGPVVQIKIYGNRQEGYLNDLQPDTTLETLQTYWGIQEYPFCVVHSIEYLVLVHQNGLKTYLIVDPPGFRIRLPEAVDDDLEMFEGPHKINGFLKNMVLHHLVQTV
jgi:hypothetical protein